MELAGVGHFLSNREVQGKNGMYYFTKLVGLENGELEFRTEKPIVGITKFAKVEFSCRITQGQYPKFELLTIRQCDAK